MVHGEYVAMPPQSRLAVDLGDGFLRKETYEGEAAQGDDDFGVYQTYLLIKVFATGLDLIRQRVTVVGRSAFHHVGDVHVRPGQTDQTKEIVQQLA